MRAKVIAIEDGNIRVSIRRAYYTQELDKRYFDLRIGEMIEVHRQINNPYLVRDERKETR